ncbi:serine O-acetyltransferase [Janthinobacterium lividum]|uniref:Serine acetyltransferase n=2 Tax=Janthinobacterium lividum TaxID=29581 RepID=A0A5C4NZM5_9BURK|nr:serine O-acetyltransferase [Janthinobacterium lividum]
MRGLAQRLAAREPLLRPMLDELILPHDSPAGLLAAVLAQRLGARDMRPAVLRPLFEDILSTQPPILASIAADLAAIAQRDPACPDALHALLNLKGFHALQTYRMAHHLWLAGRSEAAYSLSSHAASVFGIDIHPAARIGAGIMLDHGSGIVIGETAVVDDNVSILQNVTLGGTGKEHGDRHPKIRSGVMLGAGAKILGNIEIGAMSKVAAGSVVLRDVPAHCTVAGIPGRIVRYHQADSLPAFEMDQML